MTINIHEWVLRTSLKLLLSRLRTDMKEELDAKIEENRTFVHLHSQIRSLGSSRDLSQVQDTLRDPSQLQDTGRDPSQLQDTGRDPSQFQDTGRDSSQLQDTGREPSQLLFSDNPETRGGELGEVSEKLNLKLESLLNVQNRENNLKKKIQVYTRDKLIQRYETRDLQERDIVNIAFIPRTSQARGFVLF